MQLSLSYLVLQSEWRDTAQDAKVSDLKIKMAACIQQELKLLENLESILTNTKVYYCAAPDK